MIGTIFWVVFSSLFVQATFLFLTRGLKVKQRFELKRLAAQFVAALVLVLLVLYVIVAIF